MPRPSRAISVMGFRVAALAISPSDSICIPPRLGAVADVTQGTVREPVTRRRRRRGQSAARSRSRRPVARTARRSTAARISASVPTTRTRLRARVMAV